MLVGSQFSRFRRARYSSSRSVGGDVACGAPFAPLVTAPTHRAAPKVIHRSAARHPPKLGQNPKNTDFSKNLGAGHTHAQDNKPEARPPPLRGCAGTPPAQPPKWLGWDEKETHPPPQHAREDHRQPIFKSCPKAKTKPKGGRRQPRTWAQPQKGTPSG